MTQRFTGLQIESLITAAGTLELRVVEATCPEPGPDEVIIRVEASPINPSDLAVLTGPADMSALRFAGTVDRPVVVAPFPAAAMASVRSRVGQAIVPGNEGAGTVVAAGEDAASLLGKRVALWGGGLYIQFRRARSRDCVVLPDGTAPSAAAAIFVNPLTALCFIETMRAEGHTGIVHFAAASNLGQMLNRICLQDDIPLVNVVRSEDQAALLRAAGAVHVLNSSDPAFEVALVEAVAATGATIAFDPIAGGRQAGLSTLR